MPFHQNRIPNRHQTRMRQAFVMMGGINLSAISNRHIKIGLQLSTYPASILHGVTNLLNPYPHTFLFTVIATNKLPATGL